MVPDVDKSIIILMIYKKLDNHNITFGKSKYRLC